MRHLVWAGVRGGAGGAQGGRHGVGTGKPRRTRGRGSGVTRPVIVPWVGGAVGPGRKRAGLAGPGAGGLHTARRGRAQAGPRGPTQAWAAPGEGRPQGVRRFPALRVPRDGRCRVTRRVRPCRPPVLGEPSVQVVRPQGEPRTKTLREGARPAPRLCPAPLGGDAHGGASEPRRRLRHPPRPRAAALAWRHRDTPPFACPAPAPGICRLELCFSQVTLLRGSPLASPGGCGRPFLWG